jgi:hypothetical protein
LFGGDGEGDGDIGEFEGGGGEAFEVVVDGGVGDGALELEGSELAADGCGE